MAGAIIIGANLPYATWASLRTAFSYPYEGFASNIEYPPHNLNEVSFKSAAYGSGLIRADQYKSSPINILVFEVLPENTRPNPSPPPRFLTDYYLRLAWWEYGGSPEGTLAPVEVQNQLIGEIVALAGGMSFPITSALFNVAPGKQLIQVAATSYPGNVVSVGKLTQIN